MKNLLFCLLLLTSANSFSQHYKIIYEKSSNGKPIEGQDPVWVFVHPKSTHITSESIVNNKAAYPIEEIVIFKDTNIIVQIAHLEVAKSISATDSVALTKQTFEYLNETKKILGYNCKKAKTIINSNTIEFWYTNELHCKGAPTVLGQNLGLVLEMVRNGNYAVTATKIEKPKTFPGIVLPKKNFDLMTYKDLLWKSRFNTIPIFKDQVINFSNESKSNDSILRFANGTIAVRKVKFPEIKIGSQIFADVTEQSNGDAYDRTGSFFMIPTDKALSFLDGLQNGAKTLPIYTNGNGKEYQGVVATEQYNPVVELMRFFTPFGIKQYNYIQLKDKTWHEIVPYRMDITDLKQNFSGKTVYVGTFIGNYDKGGHKISMNITINPSESSLDKTKISIPLFNTTNVMEMAGQEYATMFNHEKGLEVTFTLDKEIKNAKLRYITTGHGGWENGDEFVPKRNTIILNGKEMFSFIPWRQDCGGYRLFNPASGNFNDGLSSSDLSRSNWCPGTATNPIYIELGDLKAGTHTIQVKIPQGPNEGGSFSSWNVSGVLLGE